MIQKRVNFWLIFPKNQRRIQVNKKPGVNKSDCVTICVTTRLILSTNKRS